MQKAKIAKICSMQKANEDGAHWSQIHQVANLVA